MNKPILRNLAVRTALALAVVCTSGWTCAGASASPFFAPDSPWNAPLPRSAQIDPDSSGLVTELSRQVAAYGPWINSSEFSVPIYTVPADQPGVSVHIDNNNDMWTNDQDAIRLAQTLDGIPIPPGARPAAGTDKHMVIWQPSSDTMWELWMARDPAAGDVVWWRDNSPGWHAAWGAKIEHVSQSSGVVAAPYGATASGLALAGGLITHEDLASGHIDHALALAIPAVMRGQFLPPATRTDGRYDGEHAIAEGRRFRLPASLDIPSLNLPPVTRMIAEAAQRYGIIVRDYAGAVVFYSEDPVPSGNYILRQMLGGQSPAQALSSFPWSRLQAVDPVQPPAPEDPAPVADPAPVPDPGAAPPADQVLTPPASPPPVAPPASGPLAHAVAPVAPVAPRASAGRRQRIATVLRHGIRVTCKQRPGALCAVRVRIGHVVVLTGARRLAPRGRTIVPTRVTRAGRRLLVRSRRHSGTLTVSVRGGGRVTRRLTFVR